MEEREEGGKKIGTERVEEMDGISLTIMHVFIDSNLEVLRFGDVADVNNLRSTTHKVPGHLFSNAPTWPPSGHSKLVLACTKKR